MFKSLGVEVLAIYHEHARAPWQTAAVFVKTQAAITTRALLREVPPANLTCLYGRFP